MTGLELPDPFMMLTVGAALAVGGIIKGITGAGAPLLAIPVIASFHDIRLAVAVMILPNIATNIWQLFQYRSAQPGTGLMLWFPLAGAAGATLGTVALVSIPPETAQLLLAGIIFLWLGLRLFKPTLKLPIPLRDRLVLPVGLTAGLFQGAVGIAAPVAVTYLSAARLPRPEYIQVVSAFLLSMGVAQLIAQTGLGLMTRDIALLSVMALAPMSLAMVLGNHIGRRISAAAFDKVIMVFLTVVALRMLFF